VNLPTSLVNPRLERYVLKLYVTGSTQRSIRAIANITRICESLLSGRVELHIIDLYQDPQAGIADQIIALPTLVKAAPGPARRVIGDLSDRMKLLNALGLSDTGSLSE